MPPPVFFETRAKRSQTMPTYRQQWTYYEDGFGEVRDVFVMSDTFDGLWSTSVIDVNVFEIESTQQSLDITGGYIVSDELRLNLISAAALTTDDAAAISFALAARDSAVRRYCGRMINPATPIVPANDFCFQGVLIAAMSGDDLFWGGAEFDTSPAPLRQWKLTANSMDSRAILSAKTKVIASVIESAWKTTNVADRQANFRDTPNGGYPSWYSPRYRHVRYCDLVNLHTLLSKIVEKASPPGITLQFFGGTALDIYGYSAHFAFTTLIGSPDLPLRYCTSRDLPTIARNIPWIPGDLRQLRLVPEDGGYGILHVPYSLMATDGIDSVSAWPQRFETVADLLYSIAQALGMYVEFQYNGTSTITIAFKPRSSVVAGTVYLRDAIGGSINLDLLSGDGNAYLSEAWPHNREGIAQYDVDGGSVVVRDPYQRAPSGDGKRLGISISPTFCYLNGQGNDLGIESDEEGSNGWLLPHNCQLYEGNDENAMNRRGDGTDYQDDTRAIHTALYCTIPGSTKTITDGSGTHRLGDVGVSALKMWLPIYGIQVSIGGQTKYYESLRHYNSDLDGFDEGFFKAEVEITSPYICSFRSTVGGAMDWRHLAIGNLYVQDGVSYVVVGIERSGEKLETKIKLHAASRFAFAVPDDNLPGGSPTTDDPAAPQSGLDIIRYAYATSGVVTAGDAVVKLPSGEVRTMVAYHSDEKLFYGIALDSKVLEAQDNRIRVQIGGRVKYSAAFGATTGARAYVRNSGIGGTNISHTPLTDKTATEDLYADLGIWESSSILKLETPTVWVHYPPLP